MECTGDKYKQVHCTKIKHYPAVALTVICNDSNTVITNKQYMKFPSCYSCLFSHAEATVWSNITHLEACFCPPSTFF